jgi:hypothetical protein
MGREDHSRKVYPSDLTDEQWAIVAPASERSKLDLADDDRNQKEESMCVVNHTFVRLNQSTRDSYTRCPGCIDITRLCVLPVYQCCVA